jgi:cytochrome c peroxidase
MKFLVLALLFTLAAAGATTRAGSLDEAMLDKAQDCGGESCIAVLRGLFAFIDRRPHGLAGNGRSCADCHMPTDGFQLSPADAEARFQLLQARRQKFRFSDDPLFLPLDADDFRVNGASASDFSNLRENALIRITFALPSNIRLIDPATNAVSEEASVDVWRAVPSILNVKLTGPDALNPWARGPNASGGFQLDGRIGTLQEQAAGALKNHAQIAATPPADLLNGLSAFQNRMFSSPRVRALSDAIRNGASVLPDPDPRLNALQQRGKAIFARACGQCHGGPGQSTPQVPVVRYHDINTECPRPVDNAIPARFTFKPCPARLARNVRTYVITLPDGSTLTRTTSDPGRALLTGFAGVGLPARDDWSKFDIPGLRGIARTAPYFHNNSADTLEEVVDHYIALFKRIEILAPAGQPVPPVLSTDGVHVDRPPAPDEVAPLLAYLRKL